MQVKTKYQPVLDLGEQLEIKNGDVKVEDGILKIKGEAKTQYEKNIFLLCMHYMHYMRQTLPLPL